MHETKREIIEKALALFAERGYADTSIADIIKATGLSKGGLYHHFSSKDEIAEAIMDYYLGELKRNFEENAVGTPKEKLLFLAKMKTKHFEGDGHCQAFHEMLFSQKGAALRVKVAKKGRELFQPMILKILTEGKESGELKVRDPELTAYLVFALQDILHGLPHKILSDPEKLKSCKCEFSNILDVLMGIKKFE